MGQAPALVREVQALGDKLLPGDDGSKLVFAHLEALNQRLDDDFVGLIEERSSAGMPSSHILKHIYSLLAPPARVVDREATAVTSEASDDTAATLAPRADQVKKALAEASYQRLEQQFAGILEEEGQPRKDTLELLAECFKARSVLPKAVLFHVKGMRMAAYTRQSTFLARLADERASMRLYLGQCMAYDEALKEVPERLRTWEWDEGEVEKFCKFQWDKLDPLNHAVLKLRAEKLGTRYTIHDTD